MDHQESVIGFYLGGGYIFLLLILYFLFFSRRRSGFIQFVKYIMVPFTVIGGGIVYFIGYQFIPGEHSVNRIITDVFLALFSTARLFILGNDLVEIHHYVEDNHAFMFWFSIIGASAAFISASIILNLFGKRLITRMRLYFDSSLENYIFFGINKASLSLAQDLKKRKPDRLVIFIDKLDKDEDPELYHKIKESGALIISSESIWESIQVEKEESIIKLHEDKNNSIGTELHQQINLRKLRLIRKVLNRQTHLFFLTEREESNVCMARSIINEIGTLKIKHSINIHIRTTTGELDDLLHENLPILSQQLVINWINRSEIAARQLVCKYNPIDWVEKDAEKALVKSDFNILILGFDQTGRSVLRKLVEYGQFPGSRFRAIIIDQDIQVKKGRFENNYPGILSNFEVSFHELQIGKSDFFELVKQYRGSLDYIVVCLGNDKTNLHTAVDLQQMLLKDTEKKIRIITQIKDNENYDNLFSTSKPVNISIFGREKDIFTESIIVRGEIERTARQIHEYYNSLKPEESKKQLWSGLSRIKQLSNISAADHIYTKLALTGLTVNDIRQITNEDEFVGYLGKERMENLAKGEHLRWNALYFTNSWSTWALNQIPEDEESNKNDIRKLHACLVSWDELSKVKERFKEDYYQYDYENVIHIYDLIQKGIYTEN